jgi:predicted transcriptional regulator
MIAKDLISNEIPPVKTSDTGLEALNWMMFFKVSHLPIVNHEEYLGLISEDDIYDMNNPDDVIGNHKLSLFMSFATQDQHIYEVLELAARLKLSVIPVINDDKVFLGVIRMVDLLHEFAKYSAIERQGGILVLEVHINDYSPSEIAQIVESNDAKILSLYVASMPDSSRMEVTIKVNVSDLSSIIQTFYRFEYEVKASYLELDKQEDLYSSRYDLLMRYLNT